MRIHTCFNDTYTVTYTHSHMFQARISALPKAVPTIFSTYVLAQHMHMYMINILPKAVSTIFSMYVLAQHMHMYTYIIHTHTCIQTRLRFESVIFTSTHTHTHTYTHENLSDKRPKNTSQVRIRDLPKMCVRNIVRLEADTLLFEVMRRFKAVR